MDRARKATPSAARSRPSNVEPRLHHALPKRILLAGVGPTPNGKGAAKPKPRRPHFPTSVRPDLEVLGQTEEEVTTHRIVELRIGVAVTAGTG